MKEAFLFVFGSIFSMFSFMLIFRFFFQLTLSSHEHPILKFVYAMTNFVVFPARKVIPGIFGYEIASLVLAGIVEILLLLGTRLLLGYSVSWSLFLPLLALVSIVKTIIYIILFAVFIQAILSWINPFNPMMSFLQSMTGPFLKNIRRKIPPVGGVDLSPLVLIFICQILLIWPIGSMEFYLISKI